VSSNELDRMKNIHHEFLHNNKTTQVLQINYLTADQVKDKGSNLRLVLFSRLDRCRIHDATNT